MYSRTSTSQREPLSPLSKHVKYTDDQQTDDDLLCGTFPWTRPWPAYRWVHQPKYKLAMDILSRDYMVRNHSGAYRDHRSGDLRPTIAS